VSEFRGTVLQHAHGQPHNFRADAVTRQKNNSFGLACHLFISQRLYDLPDGQSPTTATFPPFKPSSIVRIDPTVSERR
jgi:hypothetical protein